MDLGRFYQDLPKYYQYLSPAAREDWEHFQSDNPETLQAKTDLKWEVPDLVSAAILSSEAPVDPANEISNETLCLLQKETAVPKPVCIYMYLY